jgi:hypothetical protein
MKRSPWLLFLLVAVLAVGAFYGFFKLLELRFESGDVYPSSSSLRTDPLGTKVLYDALREVPGLSVSRNYQTLDKIANPAGATVFYVGIGNGPLQQDDADNLNALVNNGARLVVAMEPEQQAAVEYHAKKTAPKKPAPSGSPAKANSGTPAKAKKGTESDEDDTEIQTIEFRKFMSGWGVNIGYRRGAPDDSGNELTAEAAQPDLERSLSWHTALYFQHPTKDWRVLYQCEGDPAIMERSMGKGSIVLAADSYFLSNEAMRKERAPALLATLLAANSRVVFDESHLGVNEQPGIATLVRKYNLGGLAAALAVLAALFVWQTSSSFLPALPDQEDADVVTGKDSTAGFISLLRRGIAPAKLIGVCMEQWKQSFGRQHGKFAGMIGHMESTALTGSRDPVNTYQQLSHILAEKK